MEKIWGFHLLTPAPPHPTPDLFGLVWLVDCFFDLKIAFLITLSHVMQSASSLSFRILTQCSCLHDLDFHFCNWLLPIGYFPLIFQISMCYPSSALFIGCCIICVCSFIINSLKIMWRLAFWDFFLPFLSFFLFILWLDLRLIKFPSVSCFSIYGAFLVIIMVNQTSRIPHLFLLLC